MLEYIPLERILKDIDSTIIGRSLTYAVVLRPVLEELSKKLGYIDIKAFSFIMYEFIFHEVVYRKDKKPLDDYLKSSLEFMSTLNKYTNKEGEYIKRIEENIKKGNLDDAYMVLEFFMKEILDHEIRKNVIMYFDYLFSNYFNEEELCSLSKKITENYNKSIKDKKIDEPEILKNIWKLRMFLVI